MNAGGMEVAVAPHGTMRVNHPTKVLMGGGAFGVAMAAAIWLASGSAQVGLHGAFWISIVFMVWLDSRIAP